LLTGLCLLAALPGHAQEADTTADPPLHRIETADGQTLLGTIVSETDDTVVLDTRGVGVVRLPRAEIERMTRVDPDRLRNGEYWHPNPQSTRYLFAPNAIGLPRGEGYYQNTWILLNNVNYGVSDHFSVGAGTVPIFLFGAEALPLWVLPKVSLSSPQDQFHLAGGAVLGGVLGDNGGSTGLLYGAGTVGSRDHNATLGVGYGYTDGSLAETPLLNISGMTRISESFYLLSENYVIPGVEGGTLISAGLRWAPENFAVDFALVRPLSADLDGLVGLPWLGVTIPFGN
jgi:hypothetical protein